MRQYSSFKESGIEWIGEIPSHWEVKRLKHVSNSINGYSFKSEDFDLNKETPVIRIGDVGDVIDFENIIRIDSSYLETKGDFIVKKGDMLIGLTGGTIGKTGKYNYDFPSLLNQRVGLLRNNSMLLNHLLYHFLKSKIFMTNVLFDCYGGGQDNISMNDINNIRIPLPPLSEQEHIVSYLDDKTTKIDELIQKKLRKIDLLKEYRSSFINTVVTKGLNPNVPMKNSGIEWIGEIPSHWEVKSLKYIVNENQITLGSNTRDDYEVDYVEISDLDSYGNITNFTHYLFSESPSRCRRVLRQGDVFISTVRTYLRSIGIVENNVIDLICSTGFSVLTPKKSILSKYLFFMLRTEWFISDVVRKSEGVSYPSIQSDKLLTTKIVEPPLSEQKDIVSYLDEITSQIDKTIDIEKKKIELLKEYRQSLISNVVTGKIKVIE
jgi:type I restriction enzyme S subunit